VSYPPADPGVVVVHFEVPRRGIQLFEVDPHAPYTRRLCDGACIVHVDPAGKRYFYDGEDIAKSELVKVGDWPPVVTLHAEPRSLTMRGMGVGTIVTGALAFPAGMLLIWAGWGGPPAMVYSGFAALPLGAVLIGVGIGLTRLGKSPARIESRSATAASLRLGPDGPALVF